MFHLLCVGTSEDHKIYSTRAEFSVGFAADVDEVLDQSGRCDMLVVSAALPHDRAVRIVEEVARVRPGLHILVKDLAEAHEPATRYLLAGAAGWML